MPGDQGAQLGLFTALTGQYRSQEAYAFSQQMTLEARAQLGNITGLQVSLWSDQICWAGEIRLWVLEHGLMALQISSKARPPCSFAKHSAEAFTAVMSRVKTLPISS